MQTVTVKEQKKLLRKELIAKRKEFLQSGEKQQADERLYEKLINNTDINSAAMVLTYISQPIEADTLQLIDYCFKNRITVAVPKCTDRDMTFYVINSLDDTKTGMYGIPEPKQYCTAADKRLFSDSVCIVPGLSFDGKGYRLGYGKGYYDRFLSGFDGRSIGLCYKAFMAEKIPTDEYDLNVDYVIID